MKVNLRTEIKTAKGEPIKTNGLKVETIINALQTAPTLPTINAVINSYNEALKPLTMEEVIYTALTISLEEDKSLGFDKKMQLVKLSNKVAICETDEFEFTSEQITMLKERINKTYLDNMIVAVACGWLEGINIFTD